MFCVQCGAELSDGANFCSACGNMVGAGGESGVGNAIGAGETVESGSTPNALYAVNAERKSKIAAGILAILLGAFGAHKFYLGYTTSAVIMLLVSLLTLGLGAVVMGVIGLVEGILYLTKSDEEFYQAYDLGNREWF
jgi:TM2 domain-containing membrane protein YozV